MGKEHLGESVDNEVKEKFAKKINKINNYHNGIDFPDLPDT